jgi:uncharacterized membrane protein
MAFCVNCGATLNQQTGFCGSCGKPVAATNQAPFAASPAVNPGSSPTGWTQVAAPATPAAAAAPREGWTPIATPPPPASPSGQAGFAQSAAPPIPPQPTAPREGWTQTGSQPNAATSSTQASYVPIGGQPNAIPIGAPVGTALSSNLAAALSYVLGFITGVIFLSLDPYKQSRFVRFHAMQSILYSAACIVFSIAWRVVNGILLQVSPWIAFALIPFRLLISLGFFVLWLYLMYQAYSQREFRLPIIGAIAAKQAG